MNTTKKSLFTSLVACFVLLSMLMGTTFAWFTDIVSSENNVIQSGSLKAEMYWSDKLLAADSDEWIDASAGAVFNHDNWEPGYTQVRYVKVVNNGSLKFKWQLSIAANGKVTELSDAIDVYYVNPVSAEITSLDGLTSVGTLTDVLDGNTAEAGNLDPKDYQILAIAFHMDEYAGNEYQDMSLCEAGFSLKLIATQATGEFDSFDDQYDDIATFPGDFAAKETVSATNDVVDEAATIGEADGINAVVPTGVQLAPGVTELTLNVNAMTSSKANVQLENGETKTSLDIHVTGVSEDNTVATIISLPGLLKTGLNNSSVELYHVEDGVTNAMTQVTNPTNHNEFSYDPATGDVVVALATYSEVMAVSSVINVWDGTTATEYTGSGTEADPFLISTAEQLAYFRNQVDDGNTFEKKFVKLSNDIDLNGKNFDPIGWGYDYSDYNRTDADGKPLSGKVFKGTFDGGNHTIYNLYQNGWDLESSTGTDYTYTNCGGGLFAAACDATIKNLVIYGANITYECVEIGIVVGLAQGNCTFDNIKVYNSKIANYQRPAGGIVGEVSPAYNTTNGWYGTHTFSNVTVDSSVVVGSLWGDFDTPVGGVIGARWDDYNKSKVVMENVSVACRLDVYNDVTSSYQWYAYRRAGMLIGNTDTPPADGKNSKVATAEFLECNKDASGNETVFVYYSDWVNYHYCCFSNYNPSWPWVRVEAGENCSACSNPRYGVPTFDGVKMTEDCSKHNHVTGDKCYELIEFNQLYGGGQGVYGKPDHPGVKIVNYAYTVTYMDRGEVFKVDYVENNSVYTIKHTEYVPTRNDSDFKEWVNAGGTRAADIDIGNTTNVVVYDSWHSVYTARFLDQQGNVIYEEEFSTSQSKLNYVPDVPAVSGLDAVGWDEYNLKTAEGDIAIRPVYKCNEYVKLTPIDENNDGITDYYRVDGSNISDTAVDITIPEEVNGIKVEYINTGAFADGRLRDVFVPNSIKMLGNNAFCADSRREYPMIQIIFDGTKAEWDALVKATEAAGNTNWDDNIGAGSNIVFLRETDVGYYNMKATFLINNPPSGWEWKSGSYPSWFTERYPELAQ